MTPPIAIIVRCRCLRPFLSSVVLGHRLPSLPEVRGCWVGERVPAGPQSNHVPPLPHQLAPVRRARPRASSTSSGGPRSCSTSRSWTPTSWSARRALAAPPWTEIVSVRAGSWLPVGHLFVSVCHDEQLTPTGGTSMQLELSAEDAAFREEMRTFFTTQVPQDDPRHRRGAPRADQGADRRVPADAQRRRARRAALARGVGRSRLVRAAPAHLARGDAARRACRRRWPSTPRWSGR